MAARAPVRVVAIIVFFLLSQQQKLVPASVPLTAGREVRVTWGPSVPRPLAAGRWLAIFNVQSSCCPVPQAQASQPDAVSEGVGRKTEARTPVSHTHGTCQVSQKGLEKSLGSGPIPELTSQAW